MMAYLTGGHVLLRYMNCSKICLTERHVHMRTVLLVDMYYWKICGSGGHVKHDNI